MAIAQNVLFAARPTKSDKMTANKITDLTVLGAVQQGAFTADQITSIAKSLTPEFWQPTTSVIETAICLNLKLEYLRCEGPGTSRECLSITPKGREHFLSLLQLHSSLNTSPMNLAYEAIQFRFLDSADQDTAELVLAGLAARYNIRADNHESQRCNIPHHGRFSNIWMGLEQLRLRRMAQLCSSISSEKRGIAVCSLDLPAAAE